jgi:hypothetical protein
MSAKLSKHTTIAEYEISGEEPMASLLGPAEMMEPFLARLEYDHGKLIEISVFGFRISKRTKRATKQVAFRSFDRDELDAPDEEFAHHAFAPVPGWVRKLATVAV